jgi:hypothetical protein
MTGGNSKVYALAVVFGTVCGCAHYGSRMENLSPVSCSESEDVLASALEFTGLGLAAATPHIVQTSSDGRAVWRVEFDLHREDKSFGWLGSVTVLIERKTQHLISIRCEPKAPLNEAPSSAMATAEAKARSELSSDRLPFNVPKVTFLSALNSINEAGNEDPHLATEISGFLGLMSAHGREQQPVWMITLMGLPPGVHSVGQFEGNAEAIRGYENALRNPLTIFVDATTGAYLSAVRYSK